MVTFAATCKTRKQPGRGWFVAAALMALLVSSWSAAQSSVALERRAERQAQKQVEKQVGNKLEKQLEKQAQRRVEKQLEKALPTSAKGAEERLTGQARAQVQRSSKAKAWGAGGKPVAEDAASHQRQLARYQDIVSHQQGLRLANQWLVLSDEATLERLQQRGLTILKSTPLKSMGKVLIELQGAPEDMPDDIEALETKVARDFNHLYRSQNTRVASASNTHWSPRLALPIKADIERNTTIGLIDSALDQQHKTLVNANIRTRSFVEPGLDIPRRHGTAIASILVGEADDFAGVLPGAELYAAGVFYEAGANGEVASTSNLLLALDWLLQAGVKVINMSLAGPPNHLLEQGLKAASNQGVLLVAAAGNNGPGAPPAYPAAYEDVISVTAVNRDMQVWYRANRGPYIDLAAPGVDILHAQSAGNYASSSGTSYASSFVAALAGHLITRRSRADTLNILLQNTHDLGDSGRDEIFGYGFMRAP